MNAYKRKSGIFLTIVFLIIAVFACIAYGTEGKNTTSTLPNRQPSSQKFKIKLGPPPETTPAPSKASADPPVEKIVEKIPVKTISEPPIKIIPQHSSEIVFVLDNSGSMKKNDPDKITKGVVTNFIKNAGIGSRIGMVIFGKDARILEPITEITESATRTQFINSLEQLDYRGQLTNTPAGIERAIYELKTSERENVEKAIILLTDGIIDTGDKNRDVEEEKWLKEQLARECRELGIKIYGIAFTDKADFRLMQILALKTGGEYFRIYKAEEIQTVFNSINERIANAAIKKNIPIQEDSALKTIPETKQVTETKPESQLPKKLTLRTDPPKSSQARLDTPVEKKKLSDIIPILFLVAIILAAFIFFLMMYRTNKRDVRRVPLKKGTGGDTSRSLRPEIQAELIDVEHIIPQDSVSLTIDKASISIGRDSSNDIIIPEKVVSSLHATIEYRNGYYFLEDNRSTNGTRLNNRRVEQDTKMKLKSGDVIHFAKSEFRFLIHDQAPYGETMVIDANSIQS